MDLAREILDEMAHIDEFYTKADLREVLQEITNLCERDLMDKEMKIWSQRSLIFFKESEKNV